ncbi:hypothetical protein [Lysobacter solisilvae (ex Woo and Kim 2020)]|uniref:Uncharacterized protein n=1 Tax=Agrilutibacter terrestris TaxID=2865112 RepID=A0A7H0FVV6_9GAMM|nr:hypothetical protein [Lysobacter terrestris]QNP40172.1 hypothetical protein H8B22_11830 [Lysobacter terrestris]
MSREDVVAVAVRLFSIYVLFNILRNVPSAAQILTGPGGKEWAGVYAAVLAAGILLCAFLWFFPLSIARRLLPVMREPRSEEVIGAPIALSLGLVLIGVWLFAYSIADASYWLTLFIKSKQVTDATGTSVEWSHEQIAGIVATLVQLVLSVWLVLGNSGLRRLIYKYRYGQA